MFVNLSERDIDQIIPKKCKAKSKFHEMYNYFKSIKNTNPTDDCVNKFLYISDTNVNIDHDEKKPEDDQNDDQNESLIDLSIVRLNSDKQIDTIIDCEEQNNTDTNDKLENSIISNDLNSVREKLQNLNKFYSQSNFFI